MIYNTIQNIEYCKDFVDGIFDLLVYSHFFPVIASLVSLTIILLSSSSTLIKKIFTGVTLTFILWVLSNLVIWTNYDNNQIMMFAWSNIEIFAVALFIYLLYFIYVLIYEHDVTYRIKSIWLLMFLPLVVLSFTKFNLPGVDLAECVAIENHAYITYSSVVKGILSIWLIVLVMGSIVKNKNKRRPIMIAGLGTLFFLLSFFTTGYLASVTGNYYLEFYGLFGMIFFIVLLSLAVNRYKIMNIKIISTELLLLAIMILLSSQLLYIKSQVALMLNTFTFLFVSVLGFLLIKNIKKEIESKDTILKNSRLLEQANQNQEALLHFITHQVKGVLTKSRNIFDALLAGDYGEINPKMKEMIKYGFDSDTKGVETVQAILKASDLKTGRTLFIKKEVNLSKVVAELIEKAKEEIHVKGLNFTFDIEPNIHTTVDVLRIGEVFGNILNNAITYTPAGEIKIILKREENHIRFSVIDTGFGLTKEDKEKLFTEGGKGKDSISVNIDSTGYGLFIAKKIIEQHGGQIGAISDGRDKGSEFFVILP